MDVLKLVLLALAVTFAVVAVLTLAFDILSNDPGVTHLGRQYHHLSKPEQAFVACRQLIQSRFKGDVVAFEAFDAVSWVRLDTPAPLPDPHDADYAVYQITGPIRFNGRLQRFSCRVQSSPLDDWTLKELLFGK